MLNDGTFIGVRGMNEWRTDFISSMKLVKQVSLSSGFEIFQASGELSKRHD